MEKSDALRKIETCLKLSKSANAGEAANALRQAQRLMEKFAIDERTMATIGFTSEQVAVPIQAGKAPPAHLTALNALIRKAFGVRSVLGREIRISDPSFTVRFFGPSNRVPLAAYAHTVCFRAMNGAWTQHLRENPEYKGLHGARMGFLLGWIDAVGTTVEAFAISDEETEGTKLAIELHYGHELSKTVPRNVRTISSTVHAGREAAADFRINRPLNPSRLKIGA